MGNKEISLCYNITSCMNCIELVCFCCLCLFLLVCYISCLFAVLLFVVFLARVAFSLSMKQELNIWVYEKCQMMINQKGKVETSSAKRQIRLEICLWQRWVKISFCNFLVSHNLKHFNKNSFSLYLVCFKMFPIHVLMKREAELVYLGLD